MRYLGQRYIIDPASIPPAPTSGIHAHGHAWWSGTHVGTRTIADDVLSRCPCGARLYWREKGETENRHDPEALMECPTRAQNERERQARG
jgi:hypothetical protein